MAQYKVGLITQKNIMDTAKSLFYENGYFNTSIREIADKANIKLGTLTYYYKKEDIVRNIYSDFSIRLYSHISKYADSVNMTLEHNFFATYLMYNSILSDKNTTSFHMSIIGMNSKQRYVYNEIFMRRAKAFYRKMPSDMTYGEYMDAYIADDCVRKEFLMRYIDNETGDDISQKENINILCQRILSQTAKLMRLPQNLEKKYMEEAEAFEKTYDYSGIKLLI